MSDGDSITDMRYVIASARRNTTRLLTLCMTILLTATLRFCIDTTVISKYDDHNRLSRTITDRNRLTIESGF